VAKYILENPVRAGLVRSPQDYEFHLHRDIPSKMYLMPWVGSARGPAKAGHYDCGSG